jgi:hypothetical protein
MAGVEMQMEGGATREETAINKVRSPFLRKLWAMLMDPDCRSAISWDLPMRQSFTIHSTGEMERFVLPQFFKSHLFNSFQRQLNYFGFNKIGKDGLTYMLDLFRADAPENVLLIKRKTNTGNLKKKRRQSSGKITKCGSRRSKPRPYDTCDKPSAPIRPTHSRSGRTITWVKKEENLEEHMEDEDISSSEDEMGTFFDERPTLELMVAPPLENYARHLDDLKGLVGKFQSRSRSFYMHDPLLPPCTPITPVRQEFNLATPVLRDNLESPTTCWDVQDEPKAEPPGVKCEPKREIQCGLTRQPSFTRSLSLTAFTKEIWGDH